MLISSVEKIVRIFFTHVEITFFPAIESNSKTSIVSKMSVIAGKNFNHTTERKNLMFITTYKPISILLKVSFLTKKCGPPSFRAIVL